MKAIVQKKKKLDYKWVIVALSFSMVMICLGFCSSTKSLYIAPITQALSIDRGLFSINDSMRFMSSAIINVFFGSLMSRFGEKKLICAGFVCLILSQLTYSFATNVFVFYIGGILLGTGFSWTSTTMVGAIVNKWCRESKGTIMGAVLAANGIGGAVAIQVLSPVIEASAFGYRNAYRLSALILFVVGALIMIFFKNSPSEKSDTPTETQTKKSRGCDWVGIAYGDAVKMPYFYFAMLCIFLTGFVLQSVNGVSAAHMRDSGLDPVFISRVLSVHSLALAGFKFLTGIIYDKFGLRTTVNICSFTAVIVMVCLVMVADTFSGKIFAILYGVFSSLALPLETIILPIYAGDLFGQKSFNKILGLFVSVNTAGYALGAPMINFVFDKFGSYNPGFIFCAIVMAGVIIAMQFIISTAHRYQKKAEANANI